ncbi:hypothetical protein T492DRAFT_885581 [Pavlovales sp. CCMP2436]|nr:hypothetical protein T492DRAFT_885581 [Pavlovales sp. CCMP2436]
MLLQLVLAFPSYVYPHRARGCRASKCGVECQLRKSNRNPQIPAVSPMASDRKRAQARIDIVVELRQACAETGAEWEEPPTASAGDAFGSWRTRNRARYKSRKESHAAALARNEIDAALQVRCAQWALAYEAAPTGEGSIGRLERHARAQTRIDIVDELRQACAETGAEWEEPPTASAGEAAFGSWRTRNRARYKSRNESHAAALARNETDAEQQSADHAPTRLAEAAGYLWLAPGVCASAMRGNLWCAVSTSPKKPVDAPAKGSSSPEVSLPSSLA